jgi:hypothetical protein
VCFNPLLSNAPSVLLADLIEGAGNLATGAGAATPWVPIKLARRLVELHANTLGDLVQLALVTLDPLGQSDQFLEVGVRSLCEGVKGGLELVDTLVYLIKAPRDLFKALPQIAEQVLGCGLHRPTILPGRWHTRKSYTLFLYCPPTS